MYLQLKSTNSESESTDIFTKMCEIQKEIEKTHFQHFLEIKALCRPEQIEDFNLLSEELARIFAKPPTVR